MFGSFAFLWKFVNNGMRLYRGKDDRLNGLVGGAVAGLSILFEKKERRVDIAQQLLVRYRTLKISEFEMLERVTHHFFPSPVSLFLFLFLEPFKQSTMPEKPETSFTLRMGMPCFSV
jgi:hypothetical protein